MALSRKKATTIALDPEDLALVLEQYRRHAKPKSAAAMRALMEDLAHGAFTYAPPLLGQVSRAMEIVVYPTDPDRS